MSTRLYRKVGFAFFGAIIIIYVVVPSKKNYNRSEGFEMIKFLLRLVILKLTENLLYKALFFFTQFLITLKERF